MAIKNYSEHKTNNRTTDYDFPIKSIYIDGKNLVYIISETYVTNPNEPSISGVSSPALFKILDRNSGKINLKVS